jgi:hypothetical protein
VKAYNRHGGKSSMHYKLQQFYLRQLFRKKLVGERNKNEGTLYHLARNILWKWEIQKKIEKSCVFKKTAILQ